MVRGTFKLHIPNQHGSRHGDTVMLSIAKKTLMTAGCPKKRRRASCLGSDRASLCGGRSSADD